MFEKFCKYTPKSAAKWEKTRSKGKSHFVWLYGVMGWGLWMFVFTAVWNYFRHPDSLSQRLIINAIMWPIMGYCWGAVMWGISEKTYKKYVEQKPVL
jgi:hypothetical protein